MTELSVSGTVLHDCHPDGECFCAYEDICTGRFSTRLVRIPVWLDVILRPRHAYLVLRTRRRIAKARGAS